MIHKGMNDLALKSLLFVWRDKKSSLYFHVGTLTYNGAKYVFEYTHQSDAARKIYDAMKHGYRLHPAFVDIKKKYESSELFPAFNRRIPSNDRVDYLKILEDLNLPLDADRMDILRKTRGIISGDPYFFEESLRLNEKDNTLSTHFYINGMRYRNLPDNWSDLVRIGDELSPVQEKENKYDSNAIRLYTAEGLWLGYIPGIYSQAISALMERHVEINIRIDEKRPTYAPQWWLRVSLEASLDSEKGNQFNVVELGDLVFYAV